jgi:hypothetical protein
MPARIKVKDGMWVKDISKQKEARYSAPEQNNIANDNQKEQKEYLDAIAQLMEERDIPPQERERLERLIDEFERDAKTRAAIAQLPERPERDIRPYEGIINYIKADDGLGPWLLAGVLTRPLMLEIAPRGYKALANWLRNDSHSLEAEGLYVPTVEEINDRDIEQHSDSLGYFSRLVSTKRSRERRNQTTPTPD